MGPCTFVIVYQKLPCYFLFHFIGKEVQVEEEKYVLSINHLIFFPQNRMDLQL